MKRINTKKIICILLFLYFFPFFADANTEQLKRISVQIQWKNQFQYAGFYIAKEKGYYKDIGLDVTIEEWKKGIDISEKVATSKSQYGVIKPSVLIDISNGKDLVLLSAIYQSNPLIILADKSSGIKSIHDFKNKKIMTLKDQIFNSSLVSMFNSQGIKISDMQIVSHSLNPKDLLDGKADLMMAYISNEPFVLKELGGEPLIFTPKDYGIDFYNDILIVGREYLKKNQEEVQHFRQATLKGFNYAFNHIDETVSLIYNKYNTLKKTKKALLYEAKELKKLAYYKTSKIGDIKPEELEKIYNVYKLFGFAKSGLDIQNIVYNEILSETKLTEDEKEYLSKKQINVCISPEWDFPFYKVETDGNPVGIGIDYLNILKRKFNIHFTIVKTNSWNEALKFIKSGKCNILPFAIRRNEKIKLMNFTTPYLEFPVAITTRNNINFINELRELKGRPVAVLNNSYLNYFLKEKFRKLNVKKVKNREEGFQKINNGEIFAFIDSLPHTLYALQNSRYDEKLKISGFLKDDLEIRIGVRVQDEKLLYILQKCLNNITPQEKQEIKDKWFAIKFDKKADYFLLIKIIGFSIFISSILLYWNRKIIKLNKNLKNSKQEIEQKNKELKELSIKDGLTKLYNRFKIDELLRKEIDNSLTTNESFGGCLLDIDFFKNINDTYGHQVGDETLIKIAKFLLTHIRTSDYAGRWGGEEFLIIFPKINEQQLQILAEKIRQKIKEVSFEKVGYLTISIGITIFQKNDTIESIIKRADKALYKAKNNGRDCVIKLQDTTTV